ncbi:hypothetical protein DXG01_009390 [Tephrocybe rancida]|nr:hypothetical protein DXG01_009390 [Tephrocybe rancida]
MAWPKVRLGALLAQQMSAPPSLPTLLTPEGSRATRIVNVTSRSPSLPPVSTLSARDGSPGHPVNYAGDVSPQSSSPVSVSQSIPESSAHPPRDSSTDEDMATEQDELEGEGEGGSRHEATENEQDDEWEGIPASSPGGAPLAHPAHLDLVTKKLFFEVMRALRLEDPSPEWCASVRCSKCVKYNESCVFADPEGKRRRIPCVPCRVRGLKCSIRDVWLAERGEQTMGWPRLWSLERLPHLGHLEVRGPHVPVSDLFAVWQHAAAGSLARSQRKRSSSAASLPLLVQDEGEQRRVPVEEFVEEAGVIEKVGTRHLRTARKEQASAESKGKRRQVSEDGDIEGDAEVERVGARHPHRAKRRRIVSSPSPLPPPLLSRIRPGTALPPLPPASSEPLFLPGSGSSTPQGVLGSPLPAHPFPAPIPLPSAVPPVNHSLINPDFGAKVSSPVPHPLQPPPPASPEPLFPSSDAPSMPQGVPWSPLPAPSFPTPAPVPSVTLPADHPLHFGAKVSNPVPSPHTLLQLQRVQPSPPDHFIEPTEEGEFVEGLEAGLSTMSPSEVLGIIQQELDSLAPQQLCNILLHIKGQRQTEFEVDEKVRGWRESLSRAQGLAIGEYRRGLVIIKDRYVLETRLGVVRAELAAGLRALSLGQPEARRCFETTAQRLEDAIAMDMGTESWQHTRENARLFEGSLQQLPSTEDVRRHFFDNSRAMSPRSRQEVKREGGEAIERVPGLKPERGWKGETRPNKG